MNEQCHINIFLLLYYIFKYLANVDFIYNPYRIDGIYDYNKKDEKLFMFTCLPFKLVLCYDLKFAQMKHVTPITVHPPS